MLSRALVQGNLSIKYLSVDFKLGQCLYIDIKVAPGFIVHVGSFKWEWKVYGKNTNLQNLTNRVVV